jgi:hypothetical protein
MENVNLSENNSGFLVSAVSALLVLTMVSVGLRVYVRNFLIRSFRADDWLMLVSEVRTLWIRGSL